MQRWLYDAQNDAFRAYTNYNHLDNIQISKTNLVQITPGCECRFWYTFGKKYTYGCNYTHEYVW